MKSALMIAVIVLSASAGDILIKRAMQQTGELRRGKFLLFIRRALTNANFLVSIFFMAAGFFAFLAILSWDQISFIIPATSLEYVISTLGAKFILKENISRFRWAGTVLVCLGVALISIP